MTTRIGVIAEDDSDVAVINELIHKLLPQKKYSIKRFVGHGHGKIRGKCFQWASILKERGCSTLILLHDLDEKRLDELYSQLCTAIANCAISKHIVIIPIREIEAWLLSDNLAIKKAMNLPQSVPKVDNPQEIIDPKRRLGEIIHLRSGKTKRYVNSIHNKIIAAEVDPVNLRKCSSFIPFEDFIVNVLQ